MSWERRSSKECDDCLVLVWGIGGGCGGLVGRLNIDVYWGIGGVGGGHR